MFEQFFAIARNTLFESIRQPIVLVVLVIATVCLILSNPLATFTMEDDQRMLIDMGMATVFLCGALLAAFVATGALTREIENRTALTVISKPVGRPLFVIGKFAGVAGAMLISTAYMCFVFMLVEMHHVLETVRDPIHLPVIVFGVAAVVIGVGVAIWANYFYGKVFTSTAICVLTPLLGLAYVFSLMFDHDFRPQPPSIAFRPQIWLALAALTTAIVVMTAVAVAASARLGQVMTLVVTLGVFLTGLLSDWFIGKPIRGMQAQWLERAVAQGLSDQQEVTREIVLASGLVQRASAPEIVEVATVPLRQMAEGWESFQYAGLWVLYSVLPNFQMLWLSDALTQGHRIPVGYVGTACLYGAGYVVVAVSLAIVLFQRREVG